MALNPQQSSPAPGVGGDAARAQRLSALMDGECAPADLPRQVREGCEAWASDERWRADWHVYHLIGDALRSDELAEGAARDGAFMRSLRQRLAAEPVVLAPQPLLPAAPAASASRRSTWWVAPAAVAAGFVAVAGVLVVLNQTAPRELPVLAAAPAASGAADGLAAFAGGPVPQPLSAALLRDARLDAYVQAHRRVSNTVAVATPGNGLRSLETLQPIDK